MGPVKIRRLAAMQKQKRAKAGAGVLPMGECCQFQCCQFPIGDWNWLMWCRFLVAEMNGFVVHLCRNEKVFHPQVGLV